MLFEHPDVDVGGISISDVTKKPIATGYYTDKPQVHYFDEEWDAQQQGINQALPGTINSFTSVTRDESKTIVTAWNSTQPPKYYLYDRAKSSLEELVASQPWVNPDEMAPMQSVQYTARDGLKINGYLTLPKGSDGKNLPFIINPHGGPQARDGYGYSPETQFLANRGYAVMQINFRGSVGYGMDFVDAGNRQWGLKMQDDITDAVAWAVREGIADPERVCIYGGSYGGYAAMAGLTYTPELYKCGINYVGVTSIPLLFKTLPDAWEAGRPQMEWRIGNPKTDKALLEDRSPINHVEKIKAPLMMAYGKRDARVDLSHATRLERQLKKHKKDYQLMIKIDEGHGFRKYENRMDYYEAMEAFLKKNL